MAVNKHEGMLNKLEGFHAEARITCGSGMKSNGIINGATAERGNKKKINVFYHTQGHRDKFYRV